LHARANAGKTFVHVVVDACVGVKSPPCALTWIFILVEE
jgi:hypothetical protein